MTTLSLSKAVAGVAVVVVHCGGLRGPRLERRIRDVTSTVPDGVRVLATVTGPAELRPALAGRATLVVLGEDDGLAAIEELVCTGHGLVVLPFTAEVVAGWFDDVAARIRWSPFTISVGRVGREHVFVYPPGLTDPGAPRQLWPDRTRISRRGDSGARGTSATAHRTLGAVLIVKDEASNLASCLAAVRPLVDEVVVYDTGSNDDTVAIARNAGATVVEGYWDDDFGAARNRAMAHCTTDWLLSVDADEIAVADPRELRSWLDRAEGTLSMVRVISTSWEGELDGYESRANRMAARTGAHWEGALHEQLTSNGPGARETAEPAPLVLRHSGYSAVALAGKRGRNTTIVRQALSKALAGSTRQRDLVAHLVRSLLSTHESRDADEAVELAETLLSEPCTNGNMAQVSRVMVPTSINRGDADAARRWIGAARNYGESAGQCAVWEAAVLSGEGNDIGAHLLLEELLANPSGLGQDRWGTPFDAGVVETALGEVDLRLGDVDGASRRILQQLEQHPETIGWKTVVNALGAAGWTLGDLATRAPQAFINRSLREALTMPLHVSLVWFAALVETLPGDHRPVVAGCVAASRSSWADAAEWEVLARSRGLSGVSPLSELAASAHRSRADRAAALALLGAGFGEEEALAQLDQLVQECPPAELSRVREALMAAAPEVFEASA